MSMGGHGSENYISVSIHPDEKNLEPIPEL
jgi:hypothetical protein